MKDDKGKQKTYLFSCFIFCVVHGSKPELLSILKIDFIVSF